MFNVKQKHTLQQPILVFIIGHFFVKSLKFIVRVVEVTLNSFREYFVDSTNMLDDVPKPGLFSYGVLFFTKNQAFWGLLSNPKSSFWTFSEKYPLEMFLRGYKLNFTKLRPVEICLMMYQSRVTNFWWRSQEFVFSKKIQVFRGFIRGPKLSFFQNFRKKTLWNV